MDNTTQELLNNLTEKFKLIKGQSLQPVVVNQAEYGLEMIGAKVFQGTELEILPALKDLFYDIEEMSADTFVRKIAGDGIDLIIDFCRLHKVGVLVSD